MLTRDRFACVVGIALVSLSAGVASALPPWPGRGAVRMAERAHARLAIAEARAARADARVAGAAVVVPMPTPFMPWRLARPGLVVGVPPVPPVVALPPVPPVMAVPSVVAVPPIGPLWPPFPPFAAMWPPIPRIVIGQPPATPDAPGAAAGGPAASPSAAAEPAAAPPAGASPPPAATPPAATPPAATPPAATPPAADDGTRSVLKPAQEPAAGPVTHPPVEILPNPQ